MTRLRVAGVLILCALGVAAAACSSVLGIQDRSLDTQGGTDGAPSDVTVDGQPPVEGGTDAPSDSVSDTSTQADSADTAPPCGNPCKLASPLDFPDSITSDSKNIYWAEYGSDGMQDGFVKGCPLSGCGSGPTVYASAQANASSIITDGQTIYWANSSIGGGIYACAVSGCGGSPTLIAAADGAYGTAIDATYIYWVSGFDNSLHRAPRATDSGAMVDDLLWDAGDSLKYTSNYLAVDDASAYVLDDNSDLFKIPLGGGASVLLYASGGSGNGNSNVLLDPGGLVFGTPNYQILRASKTQPDASAVLLTTSVEPFNIAIDPATGDIYWADLGSGSTDGTIGRIHADGSGMTTLATSLISPYALTVAGGNVYWASAGMFDNMGITVPNTGALYSAPK